MSNSTLVDSVVDLQSLIKSMIGIMEKDVANLIKLENRVSTLEQLIMNYIKDEEKQRLQQSKAKNIPESYPKIRV